MQEALYIVMPAYNEAENIESAAREWYPIVEKIGGKSRLVIFDDGSRDDTYERMLRLRTEMPLFIPQTKPNSGHGATCIYAYRWALEQGADWVFQTDSDGQTSPNDFEQLWENRSRYDFLIGMRRGRQDGWGRVVISQAMRLCIMLFCKVWVRDANSPFRLMSKKFLNETLPFVPADSFLSNVILSIIARRQRQKTLWMPVAFRQRQKGASMYNIKSIVRIGLKTLKDFGTINKCQK